LKNTIRKSIRDFDFDAIAVQEICLKALPHYSPKERELDINHRFVINS